MNMRGNIRMMLTLGMMFNFSTLAMDSSSDASVRAKPSSLGQLGLNIIESKSDFTSGDREKAVDALHQFFTIEENKECENFIIDHTGGEKPKKFIKNLAQAYAKAFTTPPHRVVIIDSDGNNFDILRNALKFIDRRLQDYIFVQHISDVGFVLAGLHRHLEASLVKKKYSLLTRAGERSNVIDEKERAINKSELVGDIAPDHLFTSVLRFDEHDLGPLDVIAYKASGGNLNRHLWPSILLEKDGLHLDNLHFMSKDLSRKYHNKYVGFSDVKELVAELGMRVELGRESMLVKLAKCSNLSVSCKYEIFAEMKNASPLAAEGSWDKDAGSNCAFSSGCLMSKKSGKSYDNMTLVHFINFVCSREPCTGEKVERDDFQENEALQKICALRVTDRENKLDEANYHLHMLEQTARAINWCTKDKHCYAAFEKSYLAMKQMFEENQLGKAGELLKHSFSSYDDAYERAANFRKAPAPPRN